jgi:hypothetical protein
MRISIALMTFLLAFSPFKSLRAHMTSDVDFNFGQSSFQVKYQVNGQDASQTLDSFSTLELNYYLRQASTGIAYSMSFFELLNSQEGLLALTRISAGFRWYPLGMNGSRVIIDNDVVAKFWKPTPFIGLSLGLVNISTIELNASLTDLTPRMGAELPLTNRVLLVGQLIFATTLGSSAPSQAKAISYQGQSALFGIVVTNFFD